MPARELSTLLRNRADNGPRTALIAGAGSRVARELATLFAQDGHHLILVGRADAGLRESAETLRTRHRIRVTLIDADLFDPQAPQRIHDEVCARGIFVSYLVNDAGQRPQAGLAGGDLKEELALIQLNVASMVTLTKLFLRDMLERDEGRILQLASPDPALSSATPSAVHDGCRAFMLNFAAAAAEELRDTRVTMTALMPDHRAEPADRIAREGYRALMLGGAVGVAPAPSVPPPAASPLRGVLPAGVEGVIATRLRRRPPPSKASGRPRH